MSWISDRISDICHFIHGDEPVEPADIPEIGTTEAVPVDLADVMHQIREESEAGLSGQEEATKRYLDERKKADS